MASPGTEPPRGHAHGGRGDDVRKFHRGTAGHGGVQRGPFWEDDGSKDRDPVSFDRLCSVLVRDPFNLTLDEIGHLTPYQVRNIYFYDEKRDREPEKRQTYQEIFWAVWKRRGLKESQIEEQWRKYQEEQKNGR